MVMHFNRVLAGDFNTGIEPGIFYPRSARSSPRYIYPLFEEIGLLLTDKSEYPLLGERAAEIAEVA
jgi:hypothetical protein